MFVWFCYVRVGLLELGQREIGVHLVTKESHGRPSHTAVMVARQEEGLRDLGEASSANVAGFWMALKELVKGGATRFGATWALKSPFPSGVISNFPL